MKLFISHAHEQAATADALTIALRQEGHDVFLDRDALKAAEGYHAAIRNAIRDAELFVFLVSPHSLEAGSYALTELEVARERWHDPSGHVLPVLVAPTPFDEIPAYLKAVTVLQPQGDPVAETVARVAALQAGADRRRRRRWLGAGGGALVVLVALVLAWQARKPAPTTVCLLDVQVIEPAADAPFGRITTLDIKGAGGSSKAFIVTGGVANIDVGPLTRPDAGWIIATGTADGQPGVNFALTGCPLETLELKHDEPKVLLRISPRR